MKNLIMENLKCCYLCDQTQNLKPCSDCEIQSCHLHQKRHKLPSKNPEKSSPCLPFKREFNPKYGNILVASRDIAEGEVVLVDEAAIFMPGDEPVCLNCLANPVDTKNEKTRCEICKMPKCVKCCLVFEGSIKNPVLRKILDYHSKFECRIFSKNPPKSYPNFLYLTSAVIRLILAAKEDPVAAAALNGLMSHSEDRRNEDKNHDVVMAMVTKFLRENCQWTELTLDEVERAYGVIKTNCISYSDTTSVGLWPVISLLSHSCVSNLDILPQLGTSFGIYAQRRIAKGSQLTLNYNKALGHRLALRTQLRTNWYFNCECERCSDPTDLGSFLSSPKCENCETGFLIPERPLEIGKSWKCSESEGCPSKTSEDILILDKDIQSRVDDFEKGDSSQFGNVEDLIRDISSKVHPNYHVITALKVKVIFADADDKKFSCGIETSLEFCRDLLRLCDKIDPGTTRRRRRIETKMLQLQIAKLSQDFKGGKISKKDFILKIKQLKEVEAKRCLTTPY